ncbi:MAG: hypothetical protein KatS3mg130_1043 [Candidatus Sumerlaea sp.]|nr:MAG: hypothetical protein KatS3mg130_1043 [Candidatus Sumerlaea sp.]
MWQLHTSRTDTDTDVRAKNQNIALAYELINLTLDSVAGLGVFTKFRAIHHTNV